MRPHHALRWALVLVLGIVVAPVAVGAQPAKKVYRLGVLETTPVSLNAANLEAFRQGMRELGYVELQSYTLDYRSADGRPERFPELAAELVRLNVDLIVTRGTPAALAAKQATRTIPIVMAASGDPLGTGVVASLARPGGNITGLSAVVTEISGKRLELLKGTIPGLARVAMLNNMGNAAIVTQWKAEEVASRSLALQLHLLDVRKPEDFARAFDTALKQRAEAVVVSLDALTQTNVGRLVELSAKHRLPSMYPSREFVDAGGLMAYGVSYPDLYRRAATYVDRILKGTKPADLPVEEPTKFELVINLKTARALGLSVPQSLLLRADHLIQ